MDKIDILFIFYALFQALLEISLIMFIGKWIKKFSYSLYTLFVGIIFLGFLIHVANFIIIRLMDTSITYAIKLFLGKGIRQFFVALRATNINYWLLLLVFLGVLFLPFLGIFIYRSTQKFSHQLPFLIKKRYLISTALISLVALISIDIALNIQHSNELIIYQKKLPLGSTIIPPRKNCHNLSAHLKEPRNERETLEKIDHITNSSQRRPNIFLFVVESFRADTITPKIAPHLFDFQKHNISTTYTSSNANATHISWFSIFHSIFPYYWTTYHDTWKSGSVGLRLLKKEHYTTHVFSSAELSYFNMDRIIFGKDLELADVYKEYPEKKPHKRDKRVFEELQKTVQKASPEGNFFCLFLDSPHSEYSYPKEFKAPFSPVAKGINYFKFTANTKDVEPVRNRYWNAINYLDSLFGEFFSYLKKNNLYENSIIVITGDHGEEFFEQGSLFHGTHLNSYQTQVPIIFKIPGEKQAQTTISSHIDIFPTIIDTVFKNTKALSFFDGYSIFAHKRSPFIITVAQNGMNMPTQFVLNNGTHHFLGEFLPHRHYTEIDQLHILSIKDRNDQDINDKSFLEKLQNSFCHTFENVFLEKQ